MITLALLLLPLMAGLATSFSPEGWSAATSWWARPAGWRILLSSLLFAAAGASAGLLAGWAVALLAPRSRAGQAVVLTACCLPLLVPSSLMGVGWIMALGRDAVVTNALRRLAGEGVPTIYDWPVGAAATGLRYFGVAALVIIVARREGRASRAAERVFALPWHARARLRLAATLAPALAAWLLVVLLVQSDHILPSMFLIHTFWTEVLVQFNALMDPAGAAALTLMPAAVALVITAVCAALLREAGNREGASDDASDDAGTTGLSPWRVVRAVALMLILLPAVGVPLAGLVVRARTLANLSGAWRDAGPEVSRSMVLASLGAAATVALAIPLAHAWVMAQRSGRASPVPLVVMNLAVPSSLLALGILAMTPQRTRALLDSDVGLIFGYTARFAPVALVAMFAGWVRASPAADAAAKVFRVPAARRMLRLTLPARLPAAVAAAALVAVLVVTELEISLILIRPGPTTLGVRLYTLIHTAPDHVVAALAVDVMLVAMLLSLVVAALICAARGRRA